MKNLVLNGAKQAGILAVNAIYAIVVTFTISSILYYIFL
jgi:hypothetical protein